MTHRNKKFNKGFEILFSLVFLFTVNLPGFSMVDSCDVIVCNSNLNIAVEVGHSYPAEPEMFLEGHICMDRTYSLTYTESIGGTEYPLVDIHDGLPSKFIVIVKDDSTGNRCWTDVDFVVTGCNEIHCNNYIFMSVGEGKSYPAEVDPFLEGQWCANHDFLIEYKDDNGVWHELTNIHDGLPTVFDYRVTDLTIDKTCSGQVELKVIDCDEVFTPVLVSRNIEVNCFANLFPTYLGFPTPMSETPYEDPNSPGVFIIENWSPCGDVYLEFTDHVVEFDCDDPYQTIVYREWELKDEVEVLAEARDTYNLKRNSLDQLSAPLNFDGINGPILNCHDSWNSGNGIPTPEITGSPLPRDVCSALAADYSDQIIYGPNHPCYTLTKIIRTWTAIDWCTQETRQFLQIIKVECSDDIQAPIAICEANLSVQLNAGGTYTLYPENIDEASYDDCGISRLSFDSAGLVDQIVFDEDDANQTIPVALHVTDFAGKQNVCFTEVEVLPFVADTGNLGGKFFNYKLEPFEFEDFIQYEVSNGSAKKLVNECVIPTAHSDLSFAVCVDDNQFSGPYELNFSTPETNPITGISTVDFVILQNYLLGMLNFNDYLIFAADLNSSQTVSAADAAWIRSIILGKRKMERAPWMFVPLNDDYNFSTLPNFAPEFVPVRIGDLDHPELTAGLTGNNTRSGEDVLMYYYDKDLTNGEVFDVWFHVETPVDIVGIQIGQHFEKESLSVINATSPNFTTGQDWAGYDSEWRYFFVNPPVTNVNLKGEWLKVTFRAENSGKLSEFISQDEYPFELLVVHHDLSESRVILEVRESSTANHDYVNSHALHVYPNPFSTQTIIDFSDFEDMEGTFKIFTTDGRMLLEKELGDLRFSRQLIVDQNILKEAGLYFGVAETSAERHIVKINKL